MRTTFLSVSVNVNGTWHWHGRIASSHSQQAGTMPDKEKKEKSIFSLLRNLRGRKSDPTSSTGVVNDGECTVWLFPQALTLHAAHSLSSEDPGAGGQVGDASLSESQDFDDGTLTVASGT